MSEEEKLKLPADQVWRKIVSMHTTESLRDTLTQDVLDDVFEDHKDQAVDLRIEVFEDDCLNEVEKIIQNK